MQVKDISNIWGDLQVPQPISGGWGQDRAEDTSFVIQAGTKFPCQPSICFTLC